MSKNPGRNMRFHRRAALQGIASCALWSQSLFGTSWSRDNLNSEDAADKNGCEIEFPTMGSTINVRWLDVNAGRKQQILESAKQIAEQWVSVLSDYEPSSEMSTACEQADSGQWVMCRPSYGMLFISAINGIDGAMEPLMQGWVH